MARDWIDETLDELNGVGVDEDEDFDFAAFVHDEDSDRPFGE